MATRISITKGFDDDQFDTYVPDLSENADIRNAFELFYYGNSEDGNATGDVSLHANLVDFDARITANDSDISGHTGATLDVHGVGVGNSVVGTGTVQTLTNKTFTTPKINENVNLTATSTELNVLDGITASTAELNIMDGITASTAELNYVDGVTSSIQTQINTKSPSASPTFTGTVVLPSTTSIGNVSATEIGYIDGVTSSIQTQINSLISGVAGAVPAGTISQFAGSTAPTGYLICDGTSYSTTTYADLYGVIGYTFGGSGANFNVPNLKGKVVVGIDAAQTQFDARGETGGAMTHQHTIAASSAIASSNHAGHTHNTNLHSHGNTVNQTAAGDHSHNTNQINNTGNANAVNHNHADTLATGTSSSNLGTPLGSSQNVASSAHSHTVNGNVDSGGADHDHAITPTNIASNSGNHTHSVGVATNSDSTATAVTGGDHSHNTTVPQHTSDPLSNLQPYMALNYIIKF